MKSKSNLIFILLVTLSLISYKAYSEEEDLFKHKVTIISNIKSLIADRYMFRPNNIFFKDALNGMIVTSLGNVQISIFMTTDGGYNWQQSFIDSNRHIGDSLVWWACDQYNSKKINDSIYIITVHYSIGLDSADLLKIPPADFSYFWRTTNTGLTWDTVHIGDPLKKYTIWDISSDSTGFCAALATSSHKFGFENFIFSADKYYYYTSTDYGKTWGKPNLFPNFDSSIYNNFYNIYVTGNRNIFALNSQNDFKQQFLYSDDGGENWNVRHFPDYFRHVVDCIFFSPEKYYVYYINILSRDTTINGKDTSWSHYIGYIDFTTDGGKSWTKIYSFDPAIPETNYRNHFIMSDDNNILVHGYEYLHRTSDGGKTWSSEYNSYSEPKGVNLYPQGGMNYVKNSKYIIGGIIKNSGSIGYVAIIEDFLPNPCSLDTFNFTDFSSTKNLNFVNNALPLNNLISLTPAAVNKVGAVWYKEPLPVNCDFTVNFSFQFKNGYSDPSSNDSMPGADGIAFVIQYDNNRACGGDGGGIGYDGIPNSIAVEFDSFKNDSTQIINLNDPNDNHIAVMTNGRKPNSSKHTSKNQLGITKKRMPFKSDGTIYYSKIEYKLSEKKLNVYVNTSTPNLGLPVLEIKNLNLDSTLYLHDHSCAYIGFTSATGKSYETHNILNWSYINNIHSPSNVSDIISINDNGFGIYPNPINEIANFNFYLNQPSDVSLKLTDMLGNQISLIENQFMESGSHSYDWDASGVQAGVYYYILQIGNEVKTGKIVVIR
jgi:hypothetical protein